jgi:hypothetical protein
MLDSELPGRALLAVIQRPASAELAEQYVALLDVSCQTTFAVPGETTVLLAACWFQ